jgi:hypothetical protein
MTKTVAIRIAVISIHSIRFGILNFGHWNLPFDLAQGGELVEPFDIWYLLFVF